MASIYYDISNTLTYNSLYYFIVGERTVGLVKHTQLKSSLSEGF